MRNPKNAVVRGRPKREPYDRVLIVCEGSKTEPNYFFDIARHYELSTANIEIVGAGADPLTIVKKGKERQQKERRSGEKYDRVYCVFDRDQHAHFQQASVLAQTSKLQLGRSWPCFEFWLLLHFRFSRHPYGGSQGRSPAQKCIRDLRQYWPDYEKARDGVFLQLIDTVENAKMNADRAEADARQTGNRNPSTEVHKLVTYLEQLKQR